MNGRHDILHTGRIVIREVINNLLNLEKNLGSSFIEAVELLYSANGHNIITVGIGKSGIIAQKLSATLCSMGVFSYFLHPSEAFHGDFGKILKNDILIIFSNSGETKEILDFLAHLKSLNLNNKIIAITSRDHSSLTKIADISILTFVVKENENKNFSIVPTTSTTASLVLGDALAIALHKKRGFMLKNLIKTHPGGYIGQIVKNSL